MIRSLTLGGKIFPNNIIQGPLAGVSSAPFRLLTCQYGAPAFCCTEMLSCKALLHKSRISYERYLYKDHHEGPVCFQLFGNSPEDAVQATKIVTDYGADLIDLNCGCPVKKVRRQGAGSALLSDATKLYQILSAIKNNTHLPVAAKIRVAGGGQEQFNSDVAKAVSDAGADFLVVHGRRWTEHYETPCNYDQIAFFVNEMKIPVIGNGDIFDIDSLKKMLATGCAGAMIARGGVGRPWLARELIAKINREDFTLPTQPEIGAIFLQHVNLLLKLFGSERSAVLNARKVAKYYARCVQSNQRKEFCVAMNSCSNLLDLEQLVARCFVT